MANINWSTVITGLVVFVANALEPSLVQAGADTSASWQRLVVSALFLAAVWLTNHYKTPTVKA